MTINIVLISVGAVCGALLRWSIEILFLKNTLINGYLNHFSHLKIIPAPLAAFLASPAMLATFFANLLGGYLMGIAFYIFTQSPDIPPQYKLLIVTGFLGGLTTFSTFTAQLFNLINQGHYFTLVAAALFHVIGSIIMLILGIKSIKMIGFL